MKTTIIVIYATWFVLTIIYQFKGKVSGWLKKTDVLKLLPGWRFFAPDPLDEDFYLLYRDRKNGNVNEPKLFNESYPGVSGDIIYPQRRMENGVGKLLSWFSDPQFKHWPKGRKMLSFRYIYALSLVLRYPLEKEASRQFIIIKKSVMDAEPLIIFTSDFHEYE